ncbi:hypothetical protein, partial [Cupriavidus basilensis]|uniref:hypothetical protein n=1 Tax=Cupriavidus basilensis TaxID=68895 RepID=UPI0023E8AF23
SIAGRGPGGACARGGAAPLSAISGRELARHGDGLMQVKPAVSRITRRWHRAIGQAESPDQRWQMWDDRDGDSWQGNPSRYRTSRRRETHDTHHRPPDRIDRRVRGIADHFLEGLEVLGRRLQCRTASIHDTFSTGHCAAYADGH